LVPGFFTFAQSADTTLIREHLNFLASKDPDSFREYTNTERLDESAEYIYRVFSQYADTVWYQRFFVNGRSYCNVLCSFGIEIKERIIVGAHYDACGDQPGADDNASGTTALLELARMLSNVEVPHRIDLVAYTLEEPPFFRTEGMGSFKHVQYLKENNVSVLGMICIEMIGYFDDQRGSQRYPVGIMKLVYGSKGDYIAVVQKMGNGSFGRKFKRTFKRKSSISAKSVKAPTWVSGIDFSDHLNYWAAGISAVMITDTSFYRNAHYHLSSDTVDTLNIPKMSEVIKTIYKSLLKKY
jgi:Zn-dependent M28 family amino/carboxypeptidase